MMHILENIHVVLVETSHPGNIGATARAMKTMGLSQLSLVNPRHFPHKDAEARCSGAKDVLENAQIFPTLTEAIGQCTHVYGLSARSRSLPQPLLTPEQAAEEIKELNGTIGLVFGRERTGLTNEELMLCQTHIMIPTNPDFPALNIASAVQVMCYELFKTSTPHPSPLPQGKRALPSSQENLELFYQHLEKVLIQTEFLNPEQPKHLMKRLRRLYNRAMPTDNEVNILRGILKQVQKYIR